MKKNHLVFVAGLIAAASFLSACSGGGEETAKPVESASPAVSIDTELKEQINTGDGSAPIPGAVDSVKQENLSGACADAVEPVRAVMAKYASGLEVTDAADNEALTAGINSAREICQTEDPQQWADFYAKEYFGWLNGATE